MPHHQINIIYRDPLKGNQLRRSYKLSPGESFCEGLLFIAKALELVYGEKGKFRVCGEGELPQSAPDKINY